MGYIKDKINNKIFNKSVMDENILFDKDISMILKGIGIIAMVIYHFFAFPDFYVKEIFYPDLLPYVKFIGSLKGIIIIAIFPFITGWAYYYYKDKSYKYSLKK